MQTKICLLTILLLCLDITLSSGQVANTDTSLIRVIPKTYSITYKTDNGKDDTITFILPKITGKLNKIVIEKINHFIEDSIWGERFKPIAEGYQEINYTVVQPNKNVLSITIEWHYLSAYDSYGTEYYNFNLKTGRLIKTTDIVKSSRLDEFINVANKKLDTIYANHIKELINEYGKDEDMKKDFNGDPQKYFSELISVNRIEKSNINHIDFSIQQDGLTFYVSYNIPTALRVFGFSQDYLIQMPFKYQELNNYLVTEFFDKK